MTMNEITAFIDYEPSTGLFRWKVDHGKMKTGDTAGGLGAGGYWMIGVNGVRYYGHVLAWAIMTRRWPDHKIDHRDTVKSNNSWENLRPATTAQNAMNARKSASNSSGFKGVSWHKKAGKWQSHIMVAGRSVYLGLFDRPEDAHAAYVAASACHHRNYGRAA
jgi:hypothetical protein